jgi:hypothetical protein
VLATVTAVVAFLDVGTASATQGDPHRVTICHRTRSPNHPYVRITVDSAAVDQDTGNDSGQGDHNAEHTGPVATSTAVAEAIKNKESPYENGDGFWGDIIPPFYEDGLTAGTWPSLNWDTDGQTVFENGCGVGEEEETADLLITKNIPAVIEGDELLIIHFVLVVDGGDPDVPDDMVAECDFVYVGNSDPQSCSIGNLPPNTDFDLWETDSGGFAEMVPMDVSTGDGGTTTEIEIDNTFGPATAEACKVTVVVNGFGFDPAGTEFTFDLKVGDDVIDTVVVTVGTSTDDCETFDAALEDNVTYTVVEQDPPTGWTNNGGTGDCEFTPQYPDDADRLFTCTFTNTLTFSAPLTPGYWKTHLAPISSTCRSNQGCSSTGPWTIDYLPQCLGGALTGTPPTSCGTDGSTPHGYFVDTIAKVRAIFAAMNCSNTGSTAQLNQNAIGCLAGHLLATNLNIANGSDGTCIGIVVQKADQFLTKPPTTSVTFGGYTANSIDYDGPGVSYTNLTTGNPQARNLAIALKSALDMFNNGLGC